MFTHLYRQSISCILSTVLLGNTLYAEGIVVDSAAAVKYRSMVESTANAIPLINIVTPNTSGLSHNKFTEFNIEQRGVIFNNATSAVQTQLGGWVQGNANLGTTPARVILNEVTGTSRSLLRGYGEVAGHRADLIIANPNGITVNGGGFINTPRATLTTGTPEFSGDTLRGFHVQRGDILIEGDGINASNIDQVELYTKALQLNAKIHAKKLDTVTGENTIKRDGTVTSDNVIGTEEFSIDSSALGGIYADTIRLVGTDKGVGINLPQITYASDSLSLNADGQIILGSAYATNKIDVSSTQNAITLTTDIATDTLTLTASKALLNTGKVSVNNASIHADALTNDTGATFAAQTVDATLGTTMTNNGMLMAQTASIAAQDLRNNGSIVTDKVELNIDHSLANTGLLSAYTQMDIRASDMSSGVSAEVVAKDLTITLDNGFSNEGTIGAEAMSLTANTFLNQGDIYTDTINILSNQMVQNGGTLSAYLSAAIETKSLTNTSGATISSTALNMNVDEDIANAGSIIAHNGSMNADNMENSGSLIVDTANLDVVHSLTNTGVISGSEKITLHASDMTNSASAEIAAKEMEIVLSNNFSNSGEFISDTVSLNAHSLTNIGEMYGSVMSMELTHSITNQGTLSAFTELDLHTASLANQSGATLEATTLNAEATSGMNNQGMLRASALSLVTPTLTNNATILADTLAIEATNVTNNALLKGSDSAHITVNNTITNNGGIVGGNELAIHGRTITNNEVLYSANAIDLSASTTLRNTEGSLIKSADSITIHDTGTLRNEAARIEADGDIRIQAVTLENLSTTIPTKSSSSSTVSILDNFAPDWRDWRTTVTATETIDKTGYQPAYILSGGNMMINSATHNRYSMIAADGNLYLSGSLNNEAAIDAHEVIDISHYVEHYEKHGTFGHHAWYHNYSYYEHFDTIIDHLYSTIQSGGSIYGNLISVNNADVVSGSPVTNFSSQSIASPTVGSISSTGVTYRSTDTSAHNTLYRLPDGKYGEFVRVSNPALPYLIESNPLYTDFNTFISSDYIMSRLHLDTAANTKRLGDARYETQLVRDAVFRLTGERYLAGFGSDTAQYQSLMDNALAVSSDLNLELGVSLSASQVAALNRDIVWMEEREVSGQKVLVPVVYLASLKNQELTPGGKIIAGDDMQLAVLEAINNAGEIRARGTLLAQADSLTNMGGTIKSASDILMHATNDITNTGGTISGDNVALVSDNGAIVSRTAIKSLDLGNRIGTSGNLSLAGERASIQASGDMLISAKNDITLIGSETSAGGTIALESENVTLSALEQNTHYKTTWNKGSSEIESVKQHASTLTASGDVSIDAAKDVTVHSSNIAGNNVTLNARDNVNITASNDREFKDVHTSYKGTFGSGSSRDMNLKESVVSSSINGNNIAITSGKDTTLQAANLKAIENIQVDAAGDINVLAKAYREASLHQESKSSFGGLVSSATLDSTDAIKLREATVKTEAKNIIMNSGKDITVVASEINAAADVQLKAFENLNIIAGEEVSSEKHESQKSSFNPLGLLSLVGIDAGPIYTQEIHNKDNYDTTAKSSTIKAGGSITADTGTTNIVGSNLSAAGDVAITADIGGINIASAQELHNASTLDKKVEVKLTDVFTSSADAYANLNSGKDTKLKFNVASATFDESTTSAQSVTNVASSISSGKNVTLDSSDDIAIKGSDITARDTIDLKSKTGNISITESVDTTNTQSSEKHASAEVNLVVQNEYVETAVAVDNAIKAAEQLKATKEDYSNYKRELKKLEASLETLKKDPQVSENDIANLQGLIALTKDDEAYYIAAIAAATVNLASKTVAVAQQATAAGASTATAGFSAGLSLDIQGSKTSTDTTATKSNASNLTASNINITTDKTTDTSVTVSGSNVNAADTLNIDTHDLNVVASKDTASTNSNSKDISGSVSMTVYGAASGPQVSLGYGQNESRSNSTTYTNSTLTGNTLNLDATNDATFKGATVRADEALTVNVGNNLEVASVQDTSSSSNHGMNISGGYGMGSDNTHANTDVGLRMGNGKVESVNGGIGASNGRSYDTQTVLTSLTGDSVNITTGKDTKLSGAVIAATDANGNDTGKLGLSTNTLTTENLTDTHYNSATGFSVGANIGLTPETKDPKPDTQNKETPSGTKLNSEHLAFNTSTDTSVGKTLATIGEGTITITDPRHSVLDTESKETLNRDVTKVDKELYSSSTGTKVDATIDNRMFSKTGQEEIAEDFKKTKELLGSAYTAIEDKASKFIAETKDYLHDTTITPQQRDEIRQTGLKESFVNQLEKSGVSQENIDAILQNEDIAAILTLNDSYYKNLLNPQANASDVPPTSAEPNQDSQDSKMIYLDKITIEETSGEKVTTAQVLANAMKLGAKSVNDLVSIVGEDNAAGAVMVLQVAIEGAPKAILNTIGEGAVDKITEPLKDVTSDFIADKGLNAPNASTQSENEALHYLADQMAEFGLGAIFSGSYTVIRDAKKVADADVVSTGGKTTADNTIFTGKAEYQAPLNGTGNTYTVYQRDIDPNIVLDNINKINPKTGSYYTNQEWMAKGNSPYVRDDSGNLVQINLHHSQQQGSGPLFEVTSTTHQASENQNVLHPYKQSGDGQNLNDPVDRTAFDKDRNAYWINRSKNIQGDK